MWFSGAPPQPCYFGPYFQQKLDGMGYCAVVARPLLNHSLSADCLMNLQVSSWRSRCCIHRKWKRVSVIAMTATKESGVESSDADHFKPLDSKEASKVSDRSAEDWGTAIKLKNSGQLHMVRVEACNSGGLLVRFNSLCGFLPFSQMCDSRNPKDARQLSDIGKDLMGEKMIVKVLEVNKDEKRLIFSEKQAVWAQRVEQIKIGDIFEGRVSYITDFGVFVNLHFPDGSHPVSGLVHISELSWDRVYDPRNIVVEGQDVRVKVTNVDVERMRLGLSIKQLQRDPLFETLETVMPRDGSLDIADIKEYGSSSEPLPGLTEICEELLKEDGINEVIPGRVALEKRVVSQDLELWISNATAEEGNFKLLARAGRQVQEVNVKTSLDREGMKAAIQRVTGRVP